jgi:DnaJ-class molecular chaperone
MTCTNVEHNELDCQAAGLTQRDRCAPCKSAADGHEYRTVEGETVQVLGRFRARPDCRVCGGDGWVDISEEGDTACQACDGSGK